MECLCRRVQNDRGTVALRASRRARWYGGAGAASVAGREALCGYKPCHDDGSFPARLVEMTRTARIALEPP